MASSVRMPLTSAAMPCVLPWQPPVKTTLRIVSPSEFDVDLPGAGSPAGVGYFPDHES